MPRTYWEYPKIPHESFADDVVYFLLYEILWRQSGLAFVFQKIVPSEHPKPQPIFFIWVLGIYIAAFGLASQRHENHRDRLDNRIASLAAQLGTPARDAALERVWSLQRKEIPTEPVFTNPWSTYETLFGKEEVNQELLEEIKTITASILRSLDGPGVRKQVYSVALDKITTQGDEEGVSSTVGKNANAELTLSETVDKGEAQSIVLRLIDLSRSILVGANLQGADLGVTYLRRANLLRANLTDANLQGADLWQANLQDANLRGANLRGATFLECYQLKQALNWELAYRDEELACGESIPAHPDE